MTENNQKIWGLYWRYLIAATVLILLTSFAHGQFGVLHVVSKVDYYPSVFWAITCVCFVAPTWWQPKGLLFLLWGQRLMLTVRTWQQYNLFISLFFIGLALLPLMVYDGLSSQQWNRYKLFVQPLTLVLLPLVYAIFLLRHGNKQN